MIYAREPHFEVYQATKSITRHAFVEFIKKCSFFIETWLFNGPDGGVSLCYPVPSFEALTFHCRDFFPSLKKSSKT